MKIIGYLILTISLVFFVWQIYSASTSSKYDQMDIQQLGKIDEIDFKIYRKYTKASLAISSNDMRKANSKFSVLANYIFGGNQENTQIGMTSPVIYNINNQSTFSFIMPAKMENNLPLPNTNDIFFNTIHNQCVAVITFGGFAKQEKCEKKHEELKQKLFKIGLSFDNDFIIAVYQAPYQLINRKNEIWIELNRNQVKELLNI
ncbi:MAG: SOUL family heme-binding protein [Parvicellaceae bacterium]